MDVAALPSVPKAPASETAAMIEEAAAPADGTAANALLEAQANAGKGPLINKGSVSNAITFVIMGIFIALKMAQDDGDYSVPIDYGLAFGLFGFAGGVTNWLAVTMLFDKIPLLIGSGALFAPFLAHSRAPFLAHVCSLIASYMVSLAHFLITARRHPASLQEHPRRCEEGLYDRIL